MNNYTIEFNNNVITLWHNDRPNIWIEVEVDAYADKSREEYMLKESSVTILSDVIEKSVEREVTIAAQHKYPETNLLFNAVVHEFTLDELLNHVADNLCDGEYWAQVLADQAAFMADFFYDRMRDEGF